MFEIEYKGANCIVINAKKSRLVTDSKLSVVGLNDISTKGSVELATEERFATNNPDAILVIDSPGEYGVSDFDIKGVAAQRHIDKEEEAMASTMYRVEVGDSRIGIIGNIYEKLSDEQLEELGLLDILIIPVGGNGYTLDSTGAAGLVRAINPKIVIPVHYADNTLKYEVPQNGLEQFVAELGVPIETVSKYKSKQAPVVGATLSIVEITRS